jgi:hypothetical protein
MLSMMHVVPVSTSTVVVLLVGVAAVMALWRPLIARTGWRPLPILFAGFCLAATAALTLVGADRASITGCASVSGLDLGYVLAEAGHDLESFLNAALFLPLGLTLVLGIRRTLPPLMVVLVLPGLIEAAQLVVAGRVCSAADYVLNVAGGLVGVAAGAVAIRSWRRSDGARRE